jgi:hypothetical protein
MVLSGVNTDGRPPHRGLPPLPGACQGAFCTFRRLWTRRGINEKPKKHTVHAATGPIRHHHGATPQGHWGGTGGSRPSQPPSACSAAGNTAPPPAPSRCPQQHDQPQLTATPPRLRPTCRLHPARPTSRRPAGRGCAGQNPPSRSSGLMLASWSPHLSKICVGSAPKVPTMQSPPGQQFRAGGVSALEDPPLHRRPLQGKMAFPTIQRRWDQDSRGSKMTWFTGCRSGRLPQNHPLTRNGPSCTHLPPYFRASAPLPRARGLAPRKAPQNEVHDFRWTGRDFLKLLTYGASCGLNCPKIYFRAPKK